MLIPPERDEDLTPAQHATAGALGRVAAIIALLRGPGGCPWDHEQTFDSIKRHTLEETYEVFDAIERRDWPELKGELGDLLLQVLFYAQMAEDEGLFTLRDVAETLSAKLIRRHPHVFGEAVARDADAVVGTWEKVKAEERAAAGLTAQGLLDSVPRSMPALLEARKLGSKAAKVGFDWPDARGLFDKLAEETRELEDEVRATDVSPEAVEGELGDLLFTAVNLARHLGVDPEEALRRTNAKFRRRFAGMEQLAGSADAFATLDVEAMEALWVRVKQAEREPDAVNKEA